MFSLNFICLKLPMFMICACLNMYSVSIDFWQYKVEVEALFVITWTAAEECMPRSPAKKFPK